MPLPARLKSAQGTQTVCTFLDALETDYKLRGKLAGRSGKKAAYNLNRARRDFGRLAPRELTAEWIDKYIEARLAAGNKPSSINRTTQLIGQALNLAVDRHHLVRVPKIRHLSESGNARWDSSSPLNSMRCSPTCRMTASGISWRLPGTPDGGAVNVRP